MRWIADFLGSADVQKAVIDGKNGTDVLLDTAKQMGVKRPEVATVPQIIKANSVFDMAMEQGTFLHMAQSSVTQVVTNCERRKIGANGGLGYKSMLDGADIALLDSMILAHWICSENKAVKPKQRVSY